MRYTKIEQFLVYADGREELCGASDSGPCNRESARQSADYYKRTVVAYGYQWNAAEQRVARTKLYEVEPR